MVVLSSQVMQVWEFCKRIVCRHLAFSLAQTLVISFQLHTSCILMPNQKVVAEDEYRASKQAF